MANGTAKRTDDEAFEDDVADDDAADESESFLTRDAAERVAALS